MWRRESVERAQWSVHVVKFKLLNYASMGKTGKPSYVIGETARVDAVATQLMQVPFIRYCGIAARLRLRA